MGVRSWERLKTGGSVEMDSEEMKVFIRSVTSNRKESVEMESFKKVNNAMMATTQIKTAVLSTAKLKKFRY